MGGSGSSANYAGAAGTVYKYESRRGPQYRELKYNQNITYFKPEHSKLKVDNEHLIVNTPTLVMEENTVFYEFDEIQVYKRYLFYFCVIVMSVLHSFNFFPAILYLSFKRFFILLNLFVCLSLC